MDNKDLGRVPTAPGSREPSPDGLGPTGFDPSREAAALHPDIKLMLLASPTLPDSALMATGLTMREYEFAETSGAYRQVYRPARKEFGYQLTAKGRKLRDAIAMEARQGRDAQRLDGEAATARAEGIAQ